MIRHERSGAGDLARDATTSPQVTSIAMARARFSARTLKHHAKNAPPRPSTDSGVGIIEVVVALMILALVVLPTTRLVVSTASSTNQLHLRTEAIDLASQSLEKTEFNLNAGTAPALGTTTTTTSAGSNPFTLTTDFEELAGAGSGASLCTSTSGSPASTKIGQITETVSWKTETGGTQSVAERTLYAPAQDNFDASLNGEIAVPVDLYPSGLADTTTPVTIVLTPDQCTATSCGSIPAGDSTSGTANSGTTGCAIFTDLDPDFTYTATAVGNPGIVDYQQNSDAPTANGDPSVVGIAITTGAVQVTSPFLVGQGSNVTVNFLPLQFSSSTPSGMSPPADLPISVQYYSSTTGTITEKIGGAAVFSTSSTTPGTALLFPASPTSIWAGSTDPGSAGSGGGALSVALTSGGSASVNLPLYTLALKPSTTAALELTDDGVTVVLGTPTGPAAPYSLSEAVPTGSWTLTTTTGSAVVPSYVTVTSKGTCFGSSSVSVSSCFGSGSSTAGISVTG